MTQRLSERRSRVALSPLVSPCETCGSIAMTATSHVETVPCDSGVRRWQAAYTGTRRSRPHWPPRRHRGPGMRMTGLAAVVGVIGAALTLAACSSTRPLEKVMESGDKAYAVGDYARARADYAEYIDRKPGYPPARHKLGLAQLKTGETRAGVESLTIAFDQRPDNDEYADGLAEGLYQDDQRARLMQFLHDRTQQPGRVSDYVRLGRYAAMIGDSDQAQQALLTAARLDGGKNIEPQLALADFYKNIGDKQNAVRRLRMALYLDPENADVHARLRELGQVPGPSFVLVPEEAL